MKNLKNMFAWITLAIILTVGTGGANAGVVVLGASQCTDNNGVAQAITGVVVLGAPQFAGVVVLGAPRPCVDANAILISD